MDLKIDGVDSIEEARLLARLGAGQFGVLTELLDPVTPGRGIVDITFLKKLRSEFPNIVLSLIPLEHGEEPSSLSTAVRILDETDCDFLQLRLQRTGASLAPLRKIGQRVLSADRLVTDDGDPDWVFTPFEDFEVSIAAYQLELLQDFRNPLKALDELDLENSGLTSKALNQIASEHKMYLSFGECESSLQVVCQRFSSFQGLAFNLRYDLGNSWVLRNTVTLSWLHSWLANPRGPS